MVLFGVGATNIVMESLMCRENVEKSLEELDLGAFLRNFE